MSEATPDAETANPPPAHKGDEDEISETESTTDKVLKAVDGVLDMVGGEEMAE